MIILKTTPLNGKPPLGGWRPGIAFTDIQRGVLATVADQLIPGGDGFPAPSQAGVVPFLARYIAPIGQPNKWYPFLEESDVRGRLDGLGEAFLGKNVDDQIETLRGLERDEPEFFGRLRDLVYHAYYSRPAVVQAINERLPAGRDLRVAPQPYGYSDTIIDWDDELLSRVRGTYKRTEDVVRIELPPDLATTSAANVRAAEFQASALPESADEVRILQGGTP